MNKAEQLNILLDEWRQKNVFKPAGQRGQFIPDGIVCLDEYEKAPLKVMFVLKDTDDQNPEVYYNRGVCDEVILSENSGPTWNPVAEWAYALVTGTPDYIHARELGKNPFKKIAIMNLKKASGKGSISKDELAQFVRDHNERNEIIKELQICNPDIIIACSPDVFSVLMEDVIKNNEDVADQICYSSKMERYGHYFDIQPFVGGDKPMWVVEYRHPNRCHFMGSRQEHYENMLRIRNKLFTKQS